MSYAVFWTFDVPARRWAEFEAAYGPHGPWAQLFAQGTGYLGTELLKSIDVDGRYLTVDRWASEAAFAEFMATHGERYRSLDRDLADIATTERRIGAFHGGPDPDSEPPNPTC